MLQRLIAAVLAVLGLAAIGLGVASATAWRADDPLVATAAPGGGTRTLVTDPGVLELAGDPVTVTVRADGSPVVLVVGRDTDVTAWVGTDPYARVTGLSDWHTLSTTAVTAPEPTASPSEAAAAPTAEPSPGASASGAAAEEAEATAADPTGNDMWVAEVSGDGTATLEWPAQHGRWSLLAVSLGDTAPVLDLSWPQTVTTPWLWPGVALGVLLLAAAVILLVRILRQRREGPDAGWHSVTTGQIAVVPAPEGGAPGGAAAPAAGTGTPTGAVHIGTISATGAPLTRRQIREAEAEAAAAAAAARRRGRRNATGAIPTVTGAFPTVTGATPTVGGPGPTAAGPAPAAPDTATPTVPGGAAPTRPSPVPSTAPAAPSAPTTPPASPAPASPSGTPARTPSSPASPTATPVAAPAPRTARPAPGAAPQDATGPVDPSDAGRPRGLAARLPWRRPRPEPATDPAASPTGPGSTATGAATSWSPVPGAPAVPGSTPPPAAATPAPTGVVAPGAGDDDPAAQAQRADAWRRMWGFPSETAGPADGGTTGTGTTSGDDQHGTEEGR